MRNRNRNLTALLLTGLLAMVLLAFGGTGLLETLTGRAAPGPSTSAGPPATAGPAPALRVTAPANPSSLPSIRESQLPPDARKTLATIRAGGPYRYSQDNKTFGNFERLLPRQNSGYYREYTVPTPGESDRGARRIVTGSGGEKYYTQDHYESFNFIAEGS